MSVKNNKELSRFLRFALVGVVGAVIDFGIFNLLTSVVGMKATVAQAISFTCAVVSNFVWNRYWTYPDSRSKSVSQQVVQFGVISVIGLGIRTPLFAFLEKNLTDLFSRIFPRHWISPVFAAHNLSLAIAVLVVMMWNFLANRYWTYNDVDKPSAPIVT